MKRLAFAIVLLIAPSIALGQTNERQFSVAGFGRVFYEPDAYDLSFGIVTENEDVQKCKEAHLAAIESVKAYLAKEKARIISLKPDATRLGMWYQNREEGPRHRIPIYNFTTTYVARIKDPSSLLPLQEGMITAGVTDIYSLDMFSQSLPELFEQARKQAIKDAKAKAELVAAELGWQLVGPVAVSINDGELYRPAKASQNYGSRSYAYDAAQRPEVTNFVSANASITYRFDPLLQKTAAHEQKDILASQEVD